MIELPVEEQSIEVHDLTVVYDRKPALWDIDFQLPKGKLIGVIGPNGSGKSTLIKAIMGIVDKSSGWVKVFGEDIEDVRHKVSYVPQRESVDWDFPTNVFDVVLMGRFGRKSLWRRTSKEDKQIVEQSLKKVGMWEFKNRQIAQLSGGQQQRVFMARALAEQAEVYLMDEPFAGVDAATENSIFKVFEEVRDSGKTMMVIHHDLQSAAKYFDWIVLLNTRLIAYGPIEEVFTKEHMEEAYGGQLSVLNQVHEILRQKHYPVREK